ncbi:hypothetical protein BY458DRAFT_518848 [Sporodiniella umbellata]|nr:hypothetical protein BY458DRAFT_518848 [Sporodiniella umbellata]
MLQDLSELDFDAYFDVTSSNQPSRDILYHDDTPQQPSPQANDAIMLPSIESPDSRNSFNYFSQQQPSSNQQTFNLFDWDMRPSPIEQSPSSSPFSSSDGYTSHSLSPTLHSPLIYSTNNNIKTEANKALYLNVPGINIPSTPIHEISSQQTLATHSNLPSPPLDTPFSSMNQWNGFKGPLEDNKSWRKTTRQTNTRTISNPSLIHGPGKQLKKVAHNAIERRYRNNINDRIHELKNVVPALYKARICTQKDEEESASDSEMEIVDGVEVAKKLNKATILKKATEYIQFLKTSNDKTDNENMILQQIIAQMPGGQQVLSRFLFQKKEYESSEAERLSRERHEAQEREKIERQKVLRERAAQRAALAQLMPKQERRPYRRRQSTKKDLKKPGEEDSLSGNNKMFMAAFMCLVFFTASPISTQPSLHEPLDALSNTTSLPYSSKLENDTLVHLWTLARYTLYAFGLFYLCLVPFLFRWLRPRLVKENRKCSDHAHYDEEVPKVWNRLYLDLSRSLGHASSFLQTDVISLVLTTLDITLNLLYLLIPPYFLAFLHKARKPVGCPEEIAQLDAWVRLNEMECLGGNPNVTRLHLFYSTVAMLAQLHKMKRDPNYVALCGPGTLTRLHATAAIQCELCLPSWLANRWVHYHWQKMIQVSKEKKAWTETWLTSACHTQVRSMLSARNGFQQDECRHVLYSFVLPYVTSPMGLICYWQELEELKACWLDYLSGERPVFDLQDIHRLSPQTAPGQMLQWYVRVGLCLESLASGDCLKLLSEYHPKTLHSPLMLKHQSRILHLLEATTALVQNQKLYKVASLLELAAQERPASLKCMQQLASKSSPAEASVLVLSSLAVHLRALKALIVHGTGSHAPGFSAQQAAKYIAQLRDQVLHDLDSPFATPLSNKCKKHIQLYIYQADDALSL